MMVDSFHPRTATKNALITADENTHSSGNADILQDFGETSHENVMDDYIYDDAV